MPKIPFALQLYSVRDALQADPAAALERVKAIGYNHVELINTAGKSVEAFKADLDGAGLEVISSHVEFDRCKTDLDQAIGDCKTLGGSWAVIPYLSAEENTTVADWVARAEEMAAFGRAFKAAGISLLYHNHSHEFDAVDGKTPFDIIFETAPADDLGIELDVGWSHYGGADTLALMKRHSGRIPLLHIKDVKQRYEGETPKHTELGNGATKFAPVFKAAGEVGISWYVVEQDESARDPLESARMNAAYMRVHNF